MSWTYNLRAADQVVSDCRAGRSIRPCGAYPANIAKAARIVAGEDPGKVLGGFKVRAFYALLAGAWADPYSGIVCIDGHAVNIAEYRLFGTTKNVPWPRSYSAHTEYVRAYTAAAARKGMPPHAMQATTWLAWRRIQKEDQ